MSNYLNGKLALQIDSEFVEKIGNIYAPQDSVAIEDYRTKELKYNPNVYKNICGTVVYPCNSLKKTKINSKYRNILINFDRKRRDDFRGDQSGIAFYQLHLQEHHKACELRMTNTKSENMPAEVKEGDKVYFNYLALESKANWMYSEEHEQHLLLIDYTQLFCYVRNGKIHMLNNHVLVRKPESDDSEKKKSTGIIYKEGDTKVNEGVVHHLGKGYGYFKIDESVNVGDTILYTHNSEFRNRIEGVEYFVMKHKDIIAKYAKVDGKPTLFPLHDYVMVANRYKLKSQHMVDERDFNPTRDKGKIIIPTSSTLKSTIATLKINEKSEKKLNSGKLGAAAHGMRNKFESLAKVKKDTPDKVEILRTGPKCEMGIMVGEFGKVANKIKAHNALQVDDNTWLIPEEEMLFTAKELEYLY